MLLICGKGQKMTDKNELPVSRDFKYRLVWNSEEMELLTGKPYENPNHYPCVLMVFDLVENGENIERSISIGIGDFAQIFAFISNQVESMIKGANNLQ